MKIINSYLKKSAWALAAVLVAASCTPENPLEYDGPELFHFPSTEAPYFVLESSDPGHEVVLGVTTASATDRTFTIAVDADASSAIEGVHYTLSSTTVTIPANKFVGSVKLEGNFEKLGADGPQTLKFKLTDAANAADFNTTYEVTLQQFCPYNQADFVGTATVTSTFFGATYSVTTTAGAEAGQIILEGLYANGIDVVVNLNSADPANFTAGVVSKVAWAHPTFGDITIDNDPLGNFSSCNRTINLKTSHCLSDGRCFRDRDTLTIVMN